MAAAPGSFLAAVMLLISSGLHRSSSLPLCPDSCSCQTAPLFNCSSSGLSSVPRHIPDSVTELDLSNNLLDSVTLDRRHPDLRRVWLGNNSIAHLSLCVQRDIGGRYVRGGRLRRGLRPWRGRGCVSWAPTLQLLSVERNQLEKLPQGLEGSESLQVLQLSFNRISTIRPGELNHLQQLKELHLQHNLITSLHPQMFQDLVKLQVLDLSFNMLTSLHPLTYLSLRNIGADVMLVGNRWRCDCSIRSLRRRMAYDSSSRGLQAWSLVCASPSVLSGRDLLQLEEEELNCFSPENGPELHRDVTVYKGSEIMLSCAAQDSTWWTPSGPAPVNQPEAGLVISDITETDTGLYVCVSEEQKVVSVFNLQISKIGGATRKARSLPRIPQGTPNWKGQERNQRTTPSQLALAVCLSILITFLVAFILGVIARPWVDALWRRVTKKKRPSAPNSVSSVEQRHYENEGFCDGEEPEQMGVHRERRVTFSTIDYREDGNVKYYDTVAGGNQGINSDVVIACEAAEAERVANTAGDSGSENSLSQSSLEDNQRDRSNAGRTHNIEFEHIPDPEELVKRSSSSCSDSSRSDKVFTEGQMVRGDHSTPKTRQLAEDSVQQRADSSIEVPRISTEELPGFSSEPFADWSPYPNNTNPTDPWPENEEPFEFSDSVRSASARSSGVLGSFSDSKLTVAPTFAKQKTGDMSSSSSYVSEGEPTIYIVNSDQEDEDVERNHDKLEVLNGARFEQQIHGVDAVRPSVGFNQGDTQRPAVRVSGNSFSSHSSDEDDEDYRVKEGLVPSKSLDNRSSSPPAAYSYSSSSESEAEITNVKVEHNAGRVNEGIEINDPEMQSTDLDHQCTPQIERRVNISTPVPASDSSSSDESEDEMTKHTTKQEQVEVDTAGLQSKEYQSVSHDAMNPQWPALDLDHATPIKKHLDIKAPSPPTGSSSSSDSEDETTNHMNKQDMARLPVEVSHCHDPQPQWPALDLEQTMRIKRRLDIKAPSPPPDSSSSSDSEDETTIHKKKQEQGETFVARHPVEISQNVSLDPQQQWPVLDLEDTIRVKRHLDVKAPSPASDSSSSSDSEDETTIHTERPGKVDIAGLPFQESQTGSHDAGTRWPVLDLEDTMRIKRRLDIKAPSPASDSSSSSDREDEITIHTERPGKVDIGRLPFQECPTGSHDPDTRWPVLDLEDTMRVKRRLDIKAPSPSSDSSSSSDSETTLHTERPGMVDIGGLPFQESQKGSHDPDTRWPALDLEDTMRIKRRLDIKAPSPPNDSSSSSDSEDETTIHLKKQEQGEMFVARHPVDISQNVSRDPQQQWPVLDLEDTMRIKKRLDVKAPSPASDSSSSSNSGDETTIHAERPGKVDIGGLPFQESQKGSRDPDTRWPALGLEHTMYVKRRLDVKAPSPAFDSSSSSDSEDDTTIHIKKQEQGETFVARHPVNISQNISRDPQQQWPARDLEDTMRIKRRLDIKAPSPPPDSSSSSDSEDETTGHKKQPGKVDIGGLPFQESQTGSNDPDMRWPVLDLEHIPHIKRRLDIKAPSPASDSSSSSDSEDDTTHHIKKQKQGEMSVARLPNEVSQTPSQEWPTLDLKQTMRIKRRLDIKAPSPPPDSSSSSDSEHETTGYMTKQEQGQMNMDKVCPNISYDPQPLWPVLDLEESMRVKRRLDIKAPSPPPDSSSSSDSEDETTGHTEWPGKVDIGGLPLQESQTGSNDPDRSRWPVLDLEHIPHIKRRLDIKAPSPPPDSSSSGDSEDDTTHHIKKREQGEISVARLPSEVSQTPSHEWPTLDLEQTMRIKRRLDIKAPSPPPDSSSSSDSEDETQHHTKIERPGVVGTTGLPYQVSQTVSHDPDKRWPSIDLEHIPRIERRLDIKAPSPASDSSSSSDSEDDTTHHIKKQEQGEISVARLPSEVSKTPSHEWPTLDLEQTMRIKRRLDIKAPSPPPDSLLSDGIMNHTVKGESLEAIKVSPCHSSSSSDEQEEGVEVDPDSRWPRLDLSSALHVKRRLDIKARSPPPESSSSSVHESGATNLSVKVETKLPKLSPGVPYINRRLDFIAPSLQPDPVLSSVSPGARQSESNSSGSDGDDEYKDHAKIGLGVSAISKATEKKFIRSPKTPMINISRSPKTDIKLEKYTVIGEVGNKTSDNSSTTPEITPELQSQWAMMYLGKSRFRKRSEITTPTPEPPNLPSTPPPDSSSSESETGSQSSTTRRKRREVGVQGVNSSNSAEVTGSLRKDHSLPASEEKSYPDTKFTGNPYFRKYLDFMVREKAPAPPPPLDQPQSQTEVQRKAGVDLERQATKVGDEPDSHSSLTNVPHIKRALDIRAPVQRESSSSSNSEGETIDQSVPNLSLGVPRIKRRLDVKAPLPEPGNSASSCSESETQVTGYNQSGHATNVSGMTSYDSLIAYKRVIMKDSSLPSNSFSPSGKDQTTEDTKPRLGDRNASPAPKTAPRMTFEDIIKKRLKKAKSTTDLPPEIRWTGVGRQLSDIPIPKPRKHLGGGLSSTPAEPELPPPDSSNSSSSESDNIKQDKGQTEVPLMHRSSSLGDNSVSLASSRDFDESDNPPSSTNENLGAVSEARNEKKGLRALRAMSFQRRQWDEVDTNLDKGASPQFGPTGKSGEAIKIIPRHSSSSSDEQEESVDADPDSRWPGLDLSSALHVQRHLGIKARSPPPEASSSSVHESGSTNLPVKVETNLPKLSLGVPYINRRLDVKAPSLQPDTVFDTKVEKDTKAPTKQPPTQIHQRGATDLLHGISRYRRHDIGGTEPPQGPPPPIPSTPPPPYEAVGWRSAQSRTKQGLEGTRNSEESDQSPHTSHKLTVYFDPSNSNISEV